MITDEKKEEIREAADLVEVVGDYVRLKRSGSGFVGLCPFHDEKTPSFNVTPRLGIYKCFGCGESGDVFGFVMEMEGIGFGEALRTLAERYGVPLPEESTPEESEAHKEKEGVYHALKFAALYFFRQLLESDEAEKARAYLERRGYDRETIRKFGLGYAPAGGEVLLKAAVKEGIREEYLHKADLVKPSSRSDGFYDTFRGRLIFPIISPSGKVIAFAGRALAAAQKAKYINSAQTPVYDKSEVVYGVNFARNEIRKSEEVILVEGYTDVITLAASGIGNVVASAGTALTPRQIGVLKRYGSRIVMIYDSDNAGRMAMTRGMKIALAEGMDVELLELPDSEDPDSFIRKYDKASFLELKRKEALDFVTFTIRQSERRGEMERPSDITRVITTVLESIAVIPDPLFRQVYVQQLHQQTRRYRNGSDRELFDMLETLVLKQKRVARKQSRRPDRGAAAGHLSAPPPADSNRWGGSSENHPSTGASAQPERRRSRGEMELIRLMLQYGGEMIRYVGTLCNESLFEDEQLRNFYLDIMKRHLDGEKVTVEHYVRRNPPWPELVGDIMLEPFRPSDRHHEKTGTRFVRDRDPFRTAKSTIKPLRLLFLKKQLSRLVDRAKESGGEEKRRQIVQQQMRIQREISHMERTPADELFPDPEGSEDRPARKDKFEYVMKRRRDEW